MSPAAGHHSLRALMALIHSYTRPTPAAHLHPTSSPRYIDARECLTTAMSPARRAMHVARRVRGVSARAVVRAMTGCLQASRARPAHPRGVPPRMRTLRRITFPTSSPRHYSADRRYYTPTVRAATTVCLPPTDHYHRFELMAD